MNGDCHMQNSQTGGTTPPAITSMVAQQQLSTSSSALSDDANRLLTEEEEEVEEVDHHITVPNTTKNKTSAVATSIETTKLFMSSHSTIMNEIKKDEETDARITDTTAATSTSDILRQANVLLQRHKATSSSGESDDVVGTLDNMELHKGDMRTIWEAERESSENSAFLYMNNTMTDSTTSEDGNLKLSYSSLELQNSSSLELENSTSLEKKSHVNVDEKHNQMKPSVSAMEKADWEKEKVEWRKAWLETQMSILEKEKIKANEENSQLKDAWLKEKMEWEKEKEQLQLKNVNLEKQLHGAMIQAHMSLNQSIIPRKWIIPMHTKLWQALSVSTTKCIQNTLTIAKTRFITPLSTRYLPFLLDMCRLTKEVIILAMQHNRRGATMYSKQKQTKQRSSLKKGLAVTKLFSL